MAVAGTPCSAARRINVATDRGATLTTTRDADSPNSVAGTVTACPVVSSRRARHIHVEADAFRVERAFGQRDGQAAVGAIVRRLEDSLRCRRRQARNQRALALQIERRGQATHEAVDGLQVFAAAELAEALAEQDDRVAGSA